MIKRFASQKIIDNMQEYNCIMLYGPKLCGKTTLLKQIQSEIGGTYFDCANDHVDFEKSVYPLYLDNFDKALELIEDVKEIIKEGRKIILSVDNLYMSKYYLEDELYIMSKVVYLTYLSSKEIENKENENPINIETDIEYDNNKIFNTMFKGSLPGNINKDLNEQGVYYIDYINSLITDQVKKIDPLINKLSFAEFVSTLAEKTGEILDVDGLAYDSGISYETCKGWITLLQSLGIIFFTRPYSNENISRNKFRPKIYFYDTGLLIFLSCRGDFGIFRKSPMKIKALENYVVSEIEKSYMYSDISYSLFYYTDIKSKYDLIIRTKDKEKAVCIDPVSNPDIKKYYQTKLFDNKKLIFDDLYIFYTGKTVEKIKDSKMRYLTKIPIGSI